MFMSEKYWSIVKSEIVKCLKFAGLTDGWKKLDLKPESHERIKVFKVFHTSLELLEKEEVYITQSKQPIEVPVFVIDACQFLRQNLRIEGLFRIAGSSSKQRDLMGLLDSGNRLGLDDDQSIINVANTLKTFFRELPEPLIPHKFHTLFLKCMNNNENCVEAILLACLLLPISHLNTLCYIMQFLHDVSQQSSINKMDDGNLSIIFAPTFMPLKSRKLTRQTSLDIDQRMKIVQILIQHSVRIGVVPDNVCERLGLHLINLHSTNDDADPSSAPKPKKRRSSVTRMISGIRKIMRRPSLDSNSSQSTCSNPTPALRMRSFSSNFSDMKPSSYQGYMDIQKKREVSDDIVRTNSGNFNAILTDPYIQQHQDYPHSEHFEMAPDWENEFLSIKKRLFLLENHLHRNKITSQEETNLGGIDRNECNLVDDIHMPMVQSDLMDTSPPSNQQSEQLDFELRERNLPIRSPSARKIGSFRNKKRVNRHSSLNLDVRPSYKRQDFSKRLRRGRPNTVYTGLPHPVLIPDHPQSISTVSPSLSFTSISNILPSQSYSSIPTVTPAQCFPSTSTTQHLISNLRTSLGHTSSSSAINQKTSYNVANEQFSSPRIMSTRSPSVPESRRTSLNTFRQRNAGCVMQRARMFGDLKFTNTPLMMRKNAIALVPTSSPFKALPPHYLVKDRAPTLTGNLPTYRSPRIQRPLSNK